MNIPITPNTLSTHSHTAHESKRETQFVVCAPHVLFTNICLLVDVARVYNIESIEILARIKFNDICVCCRFDGNRASDYVHFCTLNVYIYVRTPSYSVSIALDWNVRRVPNRIA